MRLSVRWMTLGFVGLLIGVVWLADGGRLPTVILTMKAMPLGDKLGHFVLMGLLSLLVNLSLEATPTRIGPIRLSRGTLLVALLVTIEEFSQLFITSRSFEVADLAADYLGIVLFGRLADRLKGRGTMTYGCGCDAGKGVEAPASSGRNESAWLD
jgi:polysaccharide biosynthesis protein VpsQ